MDVLKQLFNDTEIDVLLTENESIKKHSKENLAWILRILSNQKCTNQVMRNIIFQNPDVLSRDPSSLEELIYKLKEYGIFEINKVADIYPFLLSKNAYEVDTFFFKMMKEGKSEEEARELLLKQPFLIDE